MKKSIVHVACLVAVLFSPLSANSQSKELLEKALGGDVNAQYELGMVYFEGKGVSKNPDRAAGLFLMAAEQKHARAQNVLSVLNPDIIARAQFNLGRMYEKGWGVTKDYKKAMEWYAKAAEQGYARAQYNLGVMYYNGWGVPKDYKKAMEWYTKAAGQGFALAQFNLGLMYGKGWGVPKDDPQSKIEAYVWLKLSKEMAPGGYRVFSKAANRLTQEEENRANKLYKKRREEIRKRMATLKKPKGQAMGAGLPPVSLRNGL